MHDELADVAWEQPLKCFAFCDRSQPRQFARDVSAIPVNLPATRLEAADLLCCEKPPEFRRDSVCAFVCERLGHEVDHRYAIENAADDVEDLIAAHLPADVFQFVEQRSEDPPF